MAGFGLFSKTSRRTQRGSAAQRAQRSLFAMSEDVPEEKPRHAPGFPVGVLDLVGLSTYRRPADQR